MSERSERTNVTASEFGVGERVLLVDSKQRRYLVTLVEGGEFHSHNGFVPHADLIGRREGIVARSTRGATYTVLRPTARETSSWRCRGVRR